MSEINTVKFSSEDDAAYVLTELLKSDEWKEKLYFDYSGHQKNPYNDQEDAQGLMMIFGTGISVYFDPSLADTVTLDILRDNIDRLAGYAMRDTKRGLYLVKQYDYPVGKFYKGIEDTEGEDCFGARVIVRKGFRHDVPMGIYVASSIPLQPDSPFLNPDLEEGDDN